MKTHFETPEEIRQQIWKELGRASQDRHHAWRTPVLATAAADGSVNARTVVLRRVDVVAGVLEIYTDFRSEKVADLVHQPRAQFVFWSERLHWQLRATVMASVASKGPDVQKLWQSVKQSPAARDYLGVQAPGALLDADRATAAILNDETHFAVVSGTVIEMDWLELARDNHRRAKLTADTWDWLKP
jgi:hypothetical protein